MALDDIRKKIKEIIFPLKHPGEICGVFIASQQASNLSKILLKDFGSSFVVLDTWPKKGECTGEIEERIREKKSLKRIKLEIEGALALFPIDICEIILRYAVTDFPFLIQLECPDSWRFQTPPKIPKWLLSHLKFVKVIFLAYYGNSSFGEDFIYSFPDFQNFTTEPYVVFQLQLGPFPVLKMEMMKAPVNPWPTMERWIPDYLDDEQ
jgi:hypothetical protein